MERLFKGISLGRAELRNRFVFPPIKLGAGSPDGTVTDRQLNLYRQIAKNGPGLLILEPVSVTPEGREHPRQPCIHLPESAAELKKIVDIIHEENRLACLHLNHAGAAANPKIINGQPRAPSVMTCVARGGSVSEELTQQEIELILDAYSEAAKKARKAEFDVIEIQGGHGYLVSQFLNRRLNRRQDKFGEDPLLFAREVLSRVKQGAQDTPCILRISGNEMSPEFGISQEDLLPLLKVSEDEGISAVHVSMGNACFSPPWYFHHAGLPEQPQIDSLSWVREHTSLPVIAAGRMGRKEKVVRFMDLGLADLVAVGRPLISDPDLIEKWQKGEDSKIRYCGYCLQGCLHRLQSGEPLGCNLNPEIGRPPLGRTENPISVLIAGGGPAGMSAAVYMARRGHKVTLAEKADHLGGQFALAWQAPAKESMKKGLENLIASVKSEKVSLFLQKEADENLLHDIKPDLLVWAPGAFQNVPEIPGLEEQNVMTSVEYFQGGKEVAGPRVLVIGAGRTGLEIVEKLGQDGYEVVTTKRTDPIGSMMEAITKNLVLKKIGEMNNVIVMPHTTVKAFLAKSVDIEQDGARMSLEPFQTVILASGMLSASGPEDELCKSVPKIEVIGDAKDVRDIFSAIHEGYELALAY